MTRIHRFLTILSIVLFAILLIGCASTPTPDPSIVWSDDFEDGDTEGWLECLSYSSSPGDYSVIDGALTFSNDDVCLRYPSTVTNGTWSADILIPDKAGTTNDITFVASQGNTETQWSTMWMAIENMPNTVIALYDSSEGVHDMKIIREDERVTDWHHVDITRDESGNMKVYFDGQMYLEQVIDFPDDSDYFAVLFSEGSGIDNIVVRNQVIEIQPSSK